jgi:hypothetical protein
MKQSVGSKAFLTLASLLVIMSLSGCSPIEQTYIGLAKDAQGNVYAYVPRCSGDNLRDLGFGTYDRKGRAVSGEKLASLQDTEVGAGKFRIAKVYFENSRIFGLAVGQRFDGHAYSSGKNVLRNLPLLGKGYAVNGHAVRKAEDLWSYCDPRWASGTGKPSYFDQK